MRRGLVAFLLWLAVDAALPPHAQPPSRPHHAHTIHAARDLEMIPPAILRQLVQAAMGAFLGSSIGFITGATSMAVSGADATGAEAIAHILAGAGAGLLAGYSMRPPKQLVVDERGVPEVMKPEARMTVGKEGMNNGAVTGLMMGCLGQVMSGSFDDGGSSASSSSSSSNHEKREGRGSGDMVAHSTLIQSAIAGAMASFAVRYVEPEITSISGFILGEPAPEEIAAIYADLAHEAVTLRGVVERLQGRRPARKKEPIGSTQPDSSGTDVATQMQGTGMFGSLKAKFNDLKSSVAEAAGAAKRSASKLSGADVADTFQKAALDAVGTGAGPGIPIPVTMGMLRNPQGASADAAKRVETAKENARNAMKAVGEGVQQVSSSISGLFGKKTKDTEEMQMVPSVVTSKSRVVSTQEQEENGDGEEEGEDGAKPTVNAEEDDVATVATSDGGDGSDGDGGDVRVVGRSIVHVD